VTLSDMSDRLSLLSSRSMSCYFGWMVYGMVMVMFIMLITIFTLITLMTPALCMYSLIKMTKVMKVRISY
jgi:hypothetical protein